MEQFKRSVLDERGRVRPMTDRKAAEVAGAAADGILKLVGCFFCPLFFPTFFFFFCPLFFPIQLFFVSCFIVRCLLPVVLFFNWFIVTIVAIVVFFSSVDSLPVVFFFTLFFYLLFFHVSIFSSVIFLSVASLSVFFFVSADTFVKCFFISFILSVSRRTPTSPIS